MAKTIHHSILFHILLLPSLHATLFSGRGAVLSSALKDATAGKGHAGRPPLRVSRHGAYVQMLRLNCAVTAEGDKPCSDEHLSSACTHSSPPSGAYLPRAHLQEGNSATTATLRTHTLCTFTATPTPAWKAASHLVHTASATPLPYHCPAPASPYVWRPATCSGKNIGRRRGPLFTTFATATRRSCHRRHHAVSDYLHVITFWPTTYTINGINGWWDGISVSLSSCRVRNCSPPQPPPTRPRRPGRPPANLRLRTLMDMVWTGTGRYLRATRRHCGLRVPDDAGEQRACDGRRRFRRRAGGRRGDAPACVLWHAYRRIWRHFIVAAALPHPFRAISPAYSRL